MHRALVVTFLAGAAFATEAPEPVRWIAAGGGATPASNQVSLEDDLALAARVLGPGGRLLFAGGPGTEGVQVLSKRPLRSGLTHTLGELFAPRGGRRATYRRVRLPADGPASAEGVETALREALTASEAAPLFVYLAAHGDPGPTPRDAQMPLWGGKGLGVPDLAAVLDAAPPGRRVRVVVTACFSGGFAEIAFTGADPEAGPAKTDRCGLFATTWDREASGCDPDPDRRRHQGYGVHFLHALAGEDRNGQPLPELDLDGDGRVSLLEAHTRVRIAGTSLDVPTTTSERWLREVAPTVGPGVSVALPEEDAVRAALSKRLGVKPQDAAAKLAEMEQEMDTVDEALAGAQGELDDAWYRLTGALLARWPVLDDPYHPDYGRMLRANRAGIRRFLDTSPLALAYRRADHRVRTLEGRLDGLLVLSAPYARLARAEENVVLAGRLHARGGSDWNRYQAFLECERSEITPLR